MIPKEIVQALNPQNKMTWFYSFDPKKVPSSEELETTEIALNEGWHDPRTKTTNTEQLDSEESNPIESISVP